MEGNGAWAASLQNLAGRQALGLGTSRTRQMLCRSEKAVYGRRSSGSHHVPSFQRPAFSFINVIVYMW